ncbi:hypothetical protein SLS56_002400 [Neofusicoccum ribis]|uniref:Phytanoyl-CoA dioxygenase n=1 Tax=Neofusicoccum ribis TaxID=45134 RepID=A0ABR3T4A2_9PEZI
MAPIDASYKPTASITSVPATAPIEEILGVIERDGGVILTNLVSPEDLAAIDKDVEAQRKDTKSTEGSAMAIVPKETLAVPGLVGKSPTVAKVCESPVLDRLRTSLLQENFSVIREDYIEENTIDPLLSISITFHIGPGGPRQRLHRDDNVHGTRHDGNFELAKVRQFGCLIAGTKTTRDNGATMFIPGSHKWDDSRPPRTDEVCFADEVRKVHGLFFIRGTMRTEENQFLAVPRSKTLQMSDKMLSLLGYKKPSTVLGIVENEDPAVNLKAVLENASK